MPLNLFRETGLQRGRHAAHQLEIEILAIFDLGAQRIEHTGFRVSAFGDHLHETRLELGLGEDAGRIKLTHLGADFIDTLRTAEKMAHEAIRADLAGKPDLVLIATGAMRHAIGESDFDFLEFYREDPAFDAIWASYREIGGAPEDYRAFVRRQETAP